MKRAAAVLAALLAIAGSAPAQTPEMVKDVNTTLTEGTGEWASRAEFVRMGGLAYFQVSDGIHGTELWRSDGTEAGTSLVRDICPGLCSSLPRELTIVGSWIYFSADDGAHGHELWKSDGTQAGTMLVKDMTPGLDDTHPSGLLALDGMLLFNAGRQELWRSDGTQAGTVLVKSFEGTSYDRPLPLAQANGIAFLRGEDGDHGSELWKTDGTSAGTVLVKDIRPGPEGGFFPGDFNLPGFKGFATLGNRLFFAASDGISGDGLWVSDGTEAGTVLVRSGPWGFRPSCLVEFGGQIFFSANGNLWKTDGTEANTVQVKEIPPLPHRNPAVQGLTVADAWLYFLAIDDTHGMELWKSDGTEENTVLVKDIRPGSGSARPFFFSASGSTLFFFADDGVSGEEPWKSDGTEAGTIRLADLNPGPGASHPFFDFFASEEETVAGGRWFFRAFDGNGDLEVYTSDGTPAGTSQLKDINSQTSAFSFTPFPEWLPNDISLADRRGTLFFGATDGISGPELWKSDGTEAGTVPVAPGSGASSPGEITALGNSVLFAARRTSPSGAELWISDGTTGGTALLKDLDPTLLTSLNGSVFFTAYNGSSSHLWKSDGTPEGTVAIGPTSAYELKPAGDFLFYNAYETGEGLWRTDGTPEGTVQLLSDNVETLTRSGNRVFFSAGPFVSGRDLWVSDGSINGTFPVKTFSHGSGILVKDFGLWPNRWAAAGSRLVFTAFEPPTGDELWVSDGTGSGTSAVLDIFPGPRSSEIEWLTAAGERSYFVADDGTHGRELWVSDGTALGTWMIADLVPGEGSSLPEQLKTVGRNLVFSAHTPDHGREPWLTDGTVEGTRRLADIAPGPIPSSPHAFTFSGPWLYFAATDSETGFELYSVPWSELDGGSDFHTLDPCRLVDTRIEGGALNGGVPRAIAAAGACGIPADAVVLAVNLIVISPTGAGSLIVHASGIPAPATTNIGFGAGQTRSNNALVSLGPGGIEAFADMTGQTHLIVDVMGYFK